jgi:hypothetical protein
MSTDENAVPHGNEQGNDEQGDEVPDPSRAAREIVASGGNPTPPLDVCVLSLSVHDRLDGERWAVDYRRAPGVPLK